MPNSSGPPAKSASCTLLQAESSGVAKLSFRKPGKKYMKKYQP
jgi:hypothetical protein